MRAPVVAQIFAWRVTEQLGYRTIANRLNADPGRYSPPIPNRPQAAKGVWCASTVSDILHNPKYTGYMVWNRVAESTSGRRNPPEAWVWSPTPTHPAIVPRELFERAAAVGRHRVGSRDGDGANLAHPDTRRSYLLRSMVVCVHCDRRMRGRTIQQRRYTYYTCRPAEAHGPRAQELWPDHPKSIAVREDYLLDGILDFFAKTVLHPERHQRLADQLATADVHSRRATERQRAGLQRTIEDLDARARRLVRALELNTALDDDRGGGVAFAEVHGRLAELQRQRDATTRDLTALDNQQQPADTGAVELLDALPVGTIALQGAPEPTLRRLFVAFQLQVRYDKHANWATLQVTLQEDRLDELLAVARAITNPHQPPAHGDGTDDSPPFAHAVPVPGATGNAWANPQPAETPRRLVLRGGFVVDGGSDRRLEERARILGFGDLRGYLQARCDTGCSVPQLAAELGVRDWQVGAALARFGVRLAPRRQRLAAQRRRYTEERIAACVAALGFADVQAYLLDRVVEQGWLLAEVTAELAAHRVTVRRLLGRHGIRRCGAPPPSERRRRLGSGCSQYRGRCGGRRGWPSSASRIWAPTCGHGMSRRGGR
jgi:hypothetical protein